MEHLRNKIKSLELEYINEINWLYEMAKKFDANSHNEIKKVSQKSGKRRVKLFIDLYEDALCEIIFSAPNLLKHYQLLHLIHLFFH